MPHLVVPGHKSPFSDTKICVLCHRDKNVCCTRMGPWGVDLHNLCPDVCVNDSETDPF